MDNQKLKSIIEAALLAAGGSMSLDQMLQLFEEEAMPEKKALREVLAEIAHDYEGRGMQLTETGSGWRIQVRAEYADWVSRLWDEKPARYSRALMETLALIAYRQPITRGEIEDVRGVSVSSNIIKTLQEREWIRVVGHRDVPGKPALYATSKIFLDYFNLKSLNDLPSLAEIRDLDSINQELQLSDPDKLEEKSGQAESEAQDIEPVEVASEADSESHSVELQDEVTDQHKEAQHREEPTEEDQKEQVKNETVENS